jgi:hypothetical protein
MGDQLNSDTEESCTVSPSKRTLNRTSADAP